MVDLEKILCFLVEKYEETPMGILVIFFIMLLGIALVVDIMLTHTYPAITLIALILFVGSTSMKAYARYLRNKPKPWDRYK